MGLFFSGGGERVVEQGALAEGTSESRVLGRGMGGAPSLVRAEHSDASLQLCNLPPQALCPLSPPLSRPLLPHARAPASNGVPLAAGRGQGSMMGSPCWPRVTHTVPPTDRASPNLNSLVPLAPAHRPRPRLPALETPPTPHPNTQAPEGAPH